MKKITKFGLIALFFSAYAYQAIKYTNAKKDKNNQKPANYSQDLLVKFAKAQVFKTTFDYPVRTLPATRRDSSTFLKACYLAAGIPRENLPEVFTANKDIALNEDGGYDFASIPVSAYIQYRDTDENGDVSYYYGLYIGKGRVIMPNEEGVVQKYQFRDTYKSHKDIVGYGILEETFAVAEKAKPVQYKDDSTPDTGAETL